MKSSAFPFIDATFIRFVLVGISNTLVGLSITFVCWHFLALGDWLSNALGYAVGFAWSFTLNRFWSFKSKGNSHDQLWRFALVCGTAYLVNLSVLSAARSVMGPTSFLPQLMAMVSYTVVNYAGCRLFVFRDPLRNS